MRKQSVVFQGGGGGEREGERVNIFKYFFLFLDHNESAADTGQEEPEENDKFLECGKLSFAVHHNSASDIQ